MHVARREGTDTIRINIVMSFRVRSFIPPRIKKNDATINTNVAIKMMAPHKNWREFTAAYLMR